MNHDNETWPSYQRLGGGGETWMRTMVPITRCRRCGFDADKQGPTCDGKER